MTARVCLTMCPPWGYPSLPIGIAYLDEYLRSNGVETEVVDLNLGLYLDAGDEARELWLPDRVLPWMEEGAFDPTAEPFASMLNESARRVLAADADLFGFSVTEVNLRFTAAVAAAVGASCPAP